MPHNNRLLNTAMSERAHLASAVTREDEEQINYGECGSLGHLLHDSHDAIRLTTENYGGCFIHRSNDINMQQSALVTA